MTQIQRALKDIDFSFAKLAFFETFLNAIVIFLVVYLVFSLFGIFQLTAIIPAVAYFVIVFVRKLTRDNVKIMENAVPDLREKLSASADTKFAINPVASELHEEVLHDLSTVEESLFFDNKSTYLKISSIVVLSFAILVLSPFSFDLDSNFINYFEPEETKEVTIIIGESKAGKKVDDSTSASLRGNDDDIFGERSVAVLGNEELTLELRPAGHEINIRDVRDAPDIEFFDVYPADITSRSSKLFEETISQEHQELVKTYFTKLAQEG